MNGKPYSNAAGLSRKRNCTCNNTSSAGFSSEDSCTRGSSGGSVALNLEGSGICIGGIGTGCWLQGGPCITAAVVMLGPTAKASALAAAAVGPDATAVAPLSAASRADTFMATAVVLWGSVARASAPATAGVQPAVATAISLAAVAAT